jgi:hypothetical protein
MEGSEFDEIEFFRAAQESGARALLIGRRALVMLGLPVLTADYDFWIHIDDAVAFNRAAEPFGLVPTRATDEARRRGRYACVRRAYRRWQGTLELRDSPRSRG